MPTDWPTGVEVSGANVSVRVDAVEGAVGEELEVDEEEWEALQPDNRKQPKTTIARENKHFILYVSA